MIAPLSALSAPSTLFAAVGPAAPSLWQLLAFTLLLLPISPPPGATGAGDDEMAYRLELVTACHAATEDRSERYLCASIPRWESSYRRDVGDCRIKGAAGELTAWQIIPRNSAERERLCVSLTRDAEVALERIRESRAACGRLPKPEQLANYARGSCDSAEGKRLSRHRWPADALVRAVETTWPALPFGTPSGGAEERP